MRGDRNGNGVVVGPGNQGGRVGGRDRDDRIGSDRARETTGRSGRDGCITQTYRVPSEEGGRTSVDVTRC
jgi:hypothetical protein